MSERAATITTLQTRLRRLAPWLPVAANVLATVALGLIVTFTATRAYNNFLKLAQDDQSIIAQSAESGVTDGLVRVSVGIEDWRDLLADFEQALKFV